MASMRQGNSSGREAQIAQTEQAKTWATRRRRDSRAGRIAVRRARLSRTRRDRASVGGLTPDAGADLAVPPAQMAAVGVGHADLGLRPPEARTRALSEGGRVARRAARGGDAPHARPHRRHGDEGRVGHAAEAVDRELVGGGRDHVGAGELVELDTERVVGRERAEAVEEVEVAVLLGFVAKPDLLGPLGQQLGLRWDGLDRAKEICWTPRASRAPRPAPPCRERRAPRRSWACGGP